ncbi:hypothetical protein GC163_20345 [bacterium]|nr:hypothetical protein [bacterium]
MPLSLMLNAMPIGGVDLFTPRIAVARDIDKQIHKVVVDRFPVGDYTDGVRINAIFKFLTEQYATLFQPALDAVASMTLLGLALGQYDLTASVEKRFKDHTLSEDDAALWRKRGPMLRRAIKWLCESLARYSSLPDDPASGNSAALSM